MSWAGSASWGWSEAWPAMGRGKGKKGGGKKGKGKHQAPAEEEGWEGGAQGAAAEQHLYRIKNRYHVAHAILKTACDQRRRGPGHSIPVKEGCQCYMLSPALCKAPRSAPAPRRRCP